MPTEMCKNHPLNMAGSHCKACHEPICNRCKLQMVDGIFCSEACLDNYRELQKQITELAPRRRKSFSIIGLFKNLLLAAILIALITGVLYWWLGTTDPGEMMEKLRKMFKLMF